MSNHFCQTAQEVIEIEARAIATLTQQINVDFANACQMILDCPGRIIIMGMGKSGHIANKLAATFASTGTPAFFVHPAEACHGDFGMVKSEDVILAISNSGKSDEILTLLPLIKRLNIRLIAITGNQHSPLAKASSIHIHLPIEMEACPHGLAPTTSTTATLVIGDALAIALLKAREFSKQDFALSHPGGSLGKKLLITVKELSHCGDALPIVSKLATISESLIEVTDKKLGMTCVVDNSGELFGVFTDGDIRRALQEEINIHTTPIQAVISKQAHIIDENMLAIDALNKMQDLSITSLVIVNNQNIPTGVIHMHDILKAGVV